MKQIINIIASQSGADITLSQKIRQGDYDAWQFDILLSDLEEAITGDVRLRFEKKGTLIELTAPVTVVGNKISYTLGTAETAISGTITCWVQFSDTNLYTPIKIIYTVEAVAQGTPIPSTPEYPEYLAAIEAAENITQTVQDTYEQAEIDRGISYGLAETARNNDYGIAEDARDSDYTGAENDRNVLYAAAEAERSVWIEWTGNEARAYKIGNKVHYLGSSYICHTSSTGNLPTDTDYWSIIVAKGDTGNTGPASELSIGTVSTLSPGSSATAQVNGTAPNQTLDLGIPAGATGSAGPSNNLTVGSVTTLAAGESATSEITGTSPNQTLNLGIPQGAKGDTGDAGTITANSTNTAMTGLVAGDGSKIQNPTATQVGNLPMSDPGNYYAGDDKLLTQMQSVGSQLAAIAIIDSRISRTKKYPFTFSSSLVDSGGRYFGATPSVQPCDAIKELHLNVSVLENYYVVYFYSFSGGKSQFRITNTSGSEMFTSAINRAEAPTGVETIALTSTLGNSGTVTIDWSKVHATNFYSGQAGDLDVDPECLHVIDIASDTTDREKRYPVTLASSLTDGSNKYFAKVAGTLPYEVFKNLQLNVGTEENYYIYWLFSYHVSGHYSGMRIRNESFTETFYLNIPRTGIPTTTDTTALVSNLGNTGTVTIDWSKVNVSDFVNGQSGDLDISPEFLKITNYPASLIVLDECIAVVGHETNVYYDSIVNGWSDEYYISATCATIPSTAMQYLAECIRITPAADQIGTHSIVIELRKKGSLNKIDGATLTVKVYADSISNAKKVMFIGDSLTYYGAIQSELINMMGANITLYGTLSVSRNDADGTPRTVLNEGRSGWTAANYISTESLNGFTNPFRNPVSGLFDFAYYCANAGLAFSDVEIVNLFIGTNDGWSNVNLTTHINSMITSIHSYNANIIITVMLPFMTPTSQDGPGMSLGSTDASRAMNFTGIQNFHDDISGANVYLIPEHYNMDTVHDYPSAAAASVSARNPATVVRVNNNVHPDVYGYYKWADVWYNWYVATIG